MSAGLVVIVVVAIALLAALLTFRASIRAIQTGRTIASFRVRESQMAAGRNLGILGLLLVLASLYFAIFGYGWVEPFFPAPTVTPTPIVLPTNTAS